LRHRLPYASIAPGFLNQLAGSFCNCLQPNPREHPDEIEASWVEPSLAGSCG